MEPWHVQDTLNAVIQLRVQLVDGGVIHSGEIKINLFPLAFRRLTQGRGPYVRAH